MKIEVKERDERESFHFFEKEKKICSTQIEGNDNNREGTKIEARTPIFIAGPYSPYGTAFSTTSMIFEADFWA